VRAVELRPGIVAGHDRLADASRDALLDLFLIASDSTAAYQSAASAEYRSGVLFGLRLAAGLVKEVPGSWETPSDVAVRGHEALQLRAAHARHPCGQQ
jgi:hypothetical protein